MLSSYDLFSLTELIRNMLKEKWKLMATLFFATMFFFHMNAKALSLNINKIKVALSLQSFNFPQIWSEFSEHTHTKLLCCINGNQFFYWRPERDTFVCVSAPRGTVPAVSEATTYCTRIEINLGCQCLQHCKTRRREQR